MEQRMRRCNTHTRRIRHGECGHKGEMGKERRMEPGRRRREEEKDGRREEEKDGIRIELGRREGRR